MKTAQQKQLITNLKTQHSKTAQKNKHKTQIYKINKTVPHDNTTTTQQNTTTTTDLLIINHHLNKTTANHKIRKQNS